MQADGVISAEPGMSVAASSTLLLNEYRDWYLGGGVLYSYYGAYGTCDFAGYTLTNSSYVGHNVSSIQGNYACDYVTLNNYGNTRRLYGPLPQNDLLGLNDNVERIHVYHSKS